VWEPVTEGGGPLAWMPISLPDARAGALGGRADTRVETGRPTPADQHCLQGPTKQESARDRRPNLNLGAGPPSTSERPKPARSAKLVNLEVYSVPIRRDGVLRLFKRLSPHTDLLVKVVLHDILLSSTGTGVIGFWP
jgi:hypothetical protein